MKQDISVIGLDLATSVFQVHGIGDDGEVVIHFGTTASLLRLTFGNLFQTTSKRVANIEPRVVKPNK